MEKERLFDSHSFQEEITNASEAKATYDYFVSNLTAFKHELAEEGLSYENTEKEVRQCWENLIKSSQKVGYINSHMERMAKKYGIGINKALFKK